MGGCVPQDDDVTSATEGASSTSTQSTTGASMDSDGASTATTENTLTSSDSTTDASISSTQPEDTEPTGTDTQDTSSTTGAWTTTGGSDGPICGDAIVEGEEECDNGGANDDKAACTAGCTIAFCGDEFIQTGKEACDNGNKNGNGSYAGCTDLCQLGPHCGDKIHQPDHEECDALDPELEDGSKCVGCTWNAHLIFASSERFTGDLGGLDGADEKCQALAQAAQLPFPSTFRAWLSDDGKSPQSRFAPHLEGPFILPNGTEIAASWSDLVSGMELKSNIFVDELKMPISKPYRAWTNTSATGDSLAGPDCNAWTQGDQMVTGSYGRTTAADSTWTSSSVDLCFEKYHLYCVATAG